MINAHTRNDSGVDDSSALATASASQWATLAGLRFLLAMVVVLGHFVRFVGPDTINIFDSTDISSRSAVWGFFVLSGFSIASSLKRDNHGYYGRRILRIYPLYIAAILIGLAFYRLGIVPENFQFPLGGDVPAPTILTVITSTLMLQTVFGVIKIVWPTWSLGIEWWHYMAAPVLSKLPNWTLAVMAGASWLGYLHLTAGPVGPAIDRIQFGWAALATSWFWLSGFLYCRLQSFFWRSALLLIPALVSILLHRFIGLPYLLTVLVLLLSSDLRISHRWVRFLNFLGDLSYPLYLFHGMALVFAVSVGQMGELRMLAISFIFSMVMLYLVDYPCRKIFKRKIGAVNKAKSVLYQPPVDL